MTTRYIALKIFATTVLLPYEDDDLCCVCLDRITSIINVPCGHKVCDICAIQLRINKANKTNKSNNFPLCVTCRAEVKGYTRQNKLHLNDLFPYVKDGECKICLKKRRVSLKSNVCGHELCSYCARDIQLKNKKNEKNEKLYCKFCGNDVDNFKKLSLNDLKIFNEVKNKMNCNNILLQRIINTDIDESISIFENTFKEKDYQSLLFFFFKEEEGYFTEMNTFVEVYFKRAIIQEENINRLIRGVTIK
ncbi:E3 ubiquitin-protein ligase TRIM38-like [Daktulosphaira vitifoliae]|uniref:E3 ubiquitin-protein ligase TRIM38-like n=1 Tax=Daktulosphaira vitifoliae TaxID=58002 RepID=UPI0021A98E26|nr:E3 ubiquitin-protein ligase TRIM38-like [Daktulosphaira vitifoliae]